MKKVPLSFICAFVLALNSYGQTGEVIVHQDPGLSKLLEVYTKGNSDPKVYTIQIGFGSYSEAEKLKSEVLLEYPEWPISIVFDSPTYRVQAGRFHNRLDAEREFLQVRQKFPGSLLLRPENRN